MAEQATILSLEKTDGALELIQKLVEQQAEILLRMDRIEHRLNLNVEKEVYTVEEAAERLDRSPWTVRQWCNKGQVKDAYKVHGKGRTGEWRVPHEALVRLQSEGPSPEGTHRAA